MLPPETAETHAHPVQAELRPCPSLKLVLLYTGFSWLVLSLYGGRVCPFLDSLSLAAWATTLFVAFAGLLALRAALVGLLVERAPLKRRVSRQFRLELGLYLTAGLCVLAYNTVARNFPPLGSGLKVVLGFSLLGLFAALDLALERERRSVAWAKATRSDILLDESHFPLTAKFATVTAAVAVGVSLVFFLVFVKDLDWIRTKDPSDPGVVVSILKEVLFIITVVLGLTLKVAFSFARNLKMLFTNQNSALKEVSAGSLTAWVPVATNDEFGRMAAYTNQMIDGLRRVNAELERTQDATIVSLASLAETRDNETGAHILRTQRYVRVLAEHLAQTGQYADTLGPAEIALLAKSAPLHDMGKVGIPDAILLKPGKLTEEEFAVMKRHPQIGRDALNAAQQMLGDNSFLRMAKEIAYSHHEKFDGSGYPLGLSGRQIPLSGRLMALADVYDALISKRIYKPAFSHEAAKDIIVQGRNAHFDPEIVDAFLATEARFRAIATELADPEKNSVGPD